MILRGISQIFFVSHPLSGILILIGLAVASPELALFTFLGVTIQTLSAWVIGLRDDAEQGLMGFNGALVGGVSYLYAGASTLGFLLAVVGSLAVLVVHQLVAKLFSAQALERFALPVSTAPFCLVATTIFFLLPELVTGTPLTSSQNALIALPLGLANSFGEVVFADGLIAGAIIFVGIFMGSRVIALYGLLGAALTYVIMAIITGGDWTTISQGLFTYPSVLAASAIGAVFCTHRTLKFKILAACAAAMLTLPFIWLLSTMGAPVLTWPYLLATWLVLILSEVIFPYAHTDTPVHSPNNS